MSGQGRNAKREGARSNELYQLQALNRIVTAISGAGAPAPSGLATESTLISVLNAIVASDQDIEILLVRDTGNADTVVQQISNWETGTPVVTYKTVNGAAYTPTGPLEYLDPSAVLNLVLAELQTLNTVDFATAANQALAIAQLTSLNAIDFATEATQATLATEVTLNSLLTAFSATDFATETTLAGIDFATETTLSSAATVLGNLLTAFNNEDFATETTLAAFSSAFSGTDFATQTTLAALAAEDFSTAANQALILAQLTTLNGLDFATETTLAALSAKFNSLGQKASAASHPVVLSTEQEAILSAIQSSIGTLNTAGLATESTLAGVATQGTLQAVANIDFATQTTLAALSAKFASLGQKANATSAAVTLSTEQETILDAIKTAVEALAADDAQQELPTALVSSSTTGAGTIPAGSKAATVFIDGVGGEINGVVRPDGWSQSFEFNNDLLPVITYNGNGAATIYVDILT